MDTVYTKYFQKSKVFLYPLLGIKKGAEFVPAETYICWDGLYEPKDQKYILVYNEERSDKFILFEGRQIKKNPHYHDCYYINNEKHIYVFDLSDKAHDYDMFLKGYFSKFSLETKNKILNYFGNIGRISDYIKSFIEPDEYHTQYAKELDVSLDLVKEVYELCSPPDLVKETLNEKIPEEITLLDNKSLYLDKINKK
jgi:hypothetical protein